MTPQNFSVRLSEVVNKIGDVDEAILITFHNAPDGLYTGICGVDLQSNYAASLFQYLDSIIKKGGEQVFKEEILKPKKG